MNRVKVLQLNKAYYPHIGGIETVVQQLAEGLAKTKDFKVEVLACNTSPRTKTSNLNQVAVTYASSLIKAFSLPISPAYISELAKKRADIVHIHEPFPLADLAYLILELDKRHRFRHLLIWWHSDIVRQKAFQAFYAPLVHRLLQRADCITVATPKHITISPFLSEVKHKCQVIPYGIDETKYKSNALISFSANEIRAKINKPIVLFVGRLVYYKGLEYLVDAMTYVSDAHLLIVGQGPLRNKLEKSANASVSGRVSFLPPQSEQNLVSLYWACDMLVLPSTEISEQFGIVQLEAMICGKPVITTDLPTGVTYVNQHKKTGLVVPVRDPRALAEAINYLICNPEMRQYLGEMARNRVLKEFTLANMISQTAKLYSEVCKECAN